MIIEYILKVFVTRIKLCISLNISEFSNIEGGILRKPIPAHDDQNLSWMRHGAIKAIERA